MEELFHVDPPQQYERKNIVGFARENYYRHNVLFLARACEAPVLADFSCVMQCKEDPRGSFYPDATLLRKSVPLEEIKWALNPNEWTPEQLKCSSRCSAFSQAVSACVNEHQRSHERWFVTHVQEKVASSCEGTNILDNREADKPVTNPKECVEGIRKAFEEGYSEEMFPRTTAAAIMMEVLMGKKKA